MNAFGEVVGINTMIFSQSVRPGAFCHSHELRRRVAEEIIQYGHRRNPWFGFRGEAVSEVNPYTLQQVGIAVETGVLVTEIHRQSPAYAAGLELGDVILTVNGEKVEHPLDIDFINWGLFIGDQVTLDINRKGRAKQIKFVVAEVGTVTS